MGIQVPEYFFQVLKVLIVLTPVPRGPCPGPGRCCRGLRKPVGRGSPRFAAVRRGSPRFAAVGRGLAAKISWPRLAAVGRGWPRSSVGREVYNSTSWELGWEANPSQGLRAR